MVTLGRKPRKVFSILLCLWASKTYSAWADGILHTAESGPLDFFWGWSQSLQLVSAPLPLPFLNLFFSTLKPEDESKFVKGMTGVFSGIVCIPPCPLSFLPSIQYISQLPASSSSPTALPTVNAYGHCLQLYFYSEDPQICSISFIPPLKV